MQHLGRKKSAATLSSLRRQAAEANMVPTETVEDKSLVYRSPGYERELNLSGSYLVDAPEGITDDSKLLCQTLLTNAQTVPQDTLFRDDLFSKTCTKISQRNEARIVEDISPLIAPSPETLATYGAMGLDHLIFNIDERWGESIPLTRTRPQPDRCVGFSDSTFNLLQLRKLRQCIGHFVPIEYLSPLLATWRMYFPFFACEAKSASEDIHVANKQNAHSMSMAVRGIVELFKEVKREDELHRKTLAFSISHNASQVRICGHYPIIQKGATTFHCHLIHSFDFTAQTGKDKWTAYQFTKNVYFEFMPKLQTLICSAIDQIVLKNDSRGSNLPPPILLGESLVTGTDKEPGQPNTLDMLASATASQNPPGSKRKRLTLKEQLEEQRKENEELRLIITSRNDSQIATLLRQQLQDSKEQMRQQQEQIKQLMDTLQTKVSAG
ncbi:MAG: hypothetical protein LQ340_002693 [Diploschistes diacapsis]|nr:MAG: hypothetical protein LQ340_002693 [Diploschistes diacapsis]